MARAHFVKKARKDVPNTDIKAGDSYWWWKFRFGGKHVSKTQPRPSQLTQSAHYGAVLDLQDLIGGLEANDGLEGVRDDIVAQLEELRDNAQESLDNMPDNLRDNSSSGEMLHERIDAMENAISEFEGLDFSDVPDDEEPEHDEDCAKECSVDKADDCNCSLSTEDRQTVDDYWQAKLEEIQSIDIS